MAVGDKHLPMLDLAALNASQVDALTKGFPPQAPAMQLDAIGAQGWNLLRGDLPFPVAVIDRDTLRANSAWMRDFTRANGLELAPHGKTTMAPHLFDRQIADGAWAITVADARQLGVAHRFGAGRVLLANQPTGRRAIDACFRVLHGDRPSELYCLADSVECVAGLAAGAVRHAPPEDNPLRVLVEIGFGGGRTGARRRELALEIARAVAEAPGLALAGIECFEGVLPDVDAAGGLVDEIVATGHDVDKAGLMADGAPMVLSAGGSAFFDRVGEKLNAAAFDRPLIRVIRSGCYLTHDTMGFAKSFSRILRDTTLTLPQGELRSALEIWAMVQSRPDPDKAILTMGKRDAGFDAGLPAPLKWFRADGSMTTPAGMPDGHVVEAMHDQHCLMKIPENSPLRVGDMVGFGIGHPCTTFDKWALMMIVDDAYNVTGAIRTFF